jgi:catalase
VDSKIAHRVAEGLGMPGEIQPVPTTVPARADVKPSPALSILGKAEPTLEGRKLGCLVADGTDAALVERLKAASAKQGANFAIIAPRVGGAKAKDGTLLEADFQLAGGSSVPFDTVYIALSRKGAETLRKEAAAVARVHDAFAHCKVVGATQGAASLLDAAGVEADQGVLVNGDIRSFLKAASAGRIWEREPRVRTIY